MCRIISQEQFLVCGHTAKCYLKHGLLYCKAPNGIPFSIETQRNRQGLYPTRFCPEEIWEEVTIQVDGLCTNCVREREPRIPAGKRKIYRCRHTRVEIPGYALQNCFSPSQPSTAAADIEDKDSTDSTPYLPFSFRFGRYRHFRFRSLGLNKNKNNLGNKAPKFALSNNEQKMLFTPISEEDVEIKEFLGSGDDAEFSWERYAKLHMWEQGNWAPCPECQRRWACRKEELQESMGLLNESAKVKETGYRARKPKGLEVVIYDAENYLHRRSKAVRGSVEEDKGTKGSLEAAEGQAFVK